jgi:hypothetical protein
MNKDRNLERLLLNKEISEPSDSMDDKIMFEIEKTVKSKASQLNRLLVWIFFSISLLTAIYISVFWSNNNSDFNGEDTFSNGIFIPVFCTFVILLLFNFAYRTKRTTN